MITEFLGHLMVDGNHPNLRSGGRFSLFLITLSQVTITLSSYLYWGHSVLITLESTLYKGIKITAKTVDEDPGGYKRWIARKET